MDIDTTEIEIQAEQSAGKSGRNLARAATIISVGTLLGSILGMIRSQVIAGIFGQGAVTGAFTIALQIPQAFYDLLIGGAIAGALVPTFVEYARPEQKEEFKRIFSTVLTMVFLLMSIAVAILFFFAPLLIPHIASGFDKTNTNLTIQMARILIPSLIGLGLFAVIMAALNARKDFLFPAFSTGAYHLGIILGAVVLSGVAFHQHWMNGLGLAAGVVLGAFGEVLLVLPGLKRQHISFRPSLHLKHPAIKQVILLYAPIALGLIFTVIGQFVGANLASRTGGGGVHGAANVSALQWATTLIQFPIGLVSAALAAAILPTLAQHINDGDSDQFKKTLATGFSFGLMLMIPSMVGLDVLRVPIIALLFQHGNFHPDATQRTALALVNFSYQLPFIVIDQLLIAAFYARKNTLTPVTVGVICVGIYIVTAYSLVGLIDMPALAFADALKSTSHAIILLILLRLAIGPLGGSKIGATVLKICAAATGMGIVGWALLKLFSRFSFLSLNHLSGQFLTVLLSGTICAAVYFALLALLRVTEVKMLVSVVQSKIGRK